LRKSVCSQQTLKGLNVQLVHQSRPVVPRDRLLRLAEVQTIIGCKKSSIYKMLDEGKFPKPIRYSARLVVWPETVVLQWVQDCINQSQKVA
jgi:prophage regulatory protein